jgi:hypothetical protein
VRIPSGQRGRLLAFAVVVAVAVATVVAIAVIDEPDPVATGTDAWQVLNDPASLDGSEVEVRGLVHVVGPDEFAITTPTIATGLLILPTAAGLPEDVREGVTVRVEGVVRDLDGDGAPAGARDRARALGNQVSEAAALEAAVIERVDGGAEAGTD